MNCLAGQISTACNYESIRRDPTEEEEDSGEEEGKEEGKKHKKVGGEICIDNLAD